MSSEQLRTYQYMCTDMMGRHGKAQESYKNGKLHGERQIYEDGRLLERSFFRAENLRENAKLGMKTGSFWSKNFIGMDSLKESARFGTQMGNSTFGSFIEMDALRENVKSGVRLDDFWNVNLIMMEIMMGNVNPGMNMGTRMSNTFMGMEN